MRVAAIGESCANAYADAYATMGAHELMSQVDMTDRAVDAALDETIDYN